MSSQNQDEDMARMMIDDIEEMSPSFCHIVFPSLKNEPVRFPPRFVREHFPNNLPRRATLELKRFSEQSWKIKLEKSGEDVYMKDGWLEFMRDANLGDKEFLVFIYTGEMSFTIKVFNKNACERMVFPELETHEYGELMQSDTQCFTSRIYRLTQVYMCKPFYVENIARRKYKFVFLKIAEGTEWFKVMLSRYRDTAFMIGGWQAFAAANHINKGSECHFEFLKENKIVVRVMKY